jgi:hypothetical protein
VADWFLKGTRKKLEVTAHNRESAFIPIDGLCAVTDRAYNKIE